MAIDFKTGHGGILQSHPEGNRPIFRHGSENGSDFIFKPLSHYRASAHVSTAYQDTKGMSRVHRTYVSICS